MKRILLIDDDTVNNYIVISTLKRCGISIPVKVCLNGAEGISYLKQVIEQDISSFPDIILLDINMPVMDGWEFLEAYEQLIHPHAGTSLIYMVSSSVYNDDIQRSKQYRSVKNFISKPLSREKMTHLLDNTI